MKKIYLLVLLSLFLIFIKNVNSQNLVSNPSFEGNAWQLDENNTNFEDWNIGRTEDNGTIKTWVETVNTHSGNKAFHWRTETPETTNISLSYYSNSSKKIPIDENNYLEAGLWSYTISGPIGLDITLHFYSEDGTFLGRFWGQERFGRFFSGQWARVSYLWYPSNLNSTPYQTGYIPKGAKYARVHIFCNWHSSGTMERIDDDVFFKEYDHLPDLNERWSEKNYLSGRLINKSGDPVQANIEVYNQGTNQVNVSNVTDSLGNYNLPVFSGIYDIMYNILNFPIPNFWIFLSSKKLSTDVHNIINYITGYGSSKLSFTVDTFYEQIIQMNSPKKPNRVLINGTKIDEVSSISELNNGTWFYNSSEKKIYINVREVPQIRIGVYTSTSTFGEYSAETIAEEFNMSQSSRWVNSVKMNRVHELNPGYKALVYRNLKDIYNYSIDEWQLANSSGWLLKDINGNFIRSPTWPENYLVDITNPDYQQWVAAKVKSWLEEYPFFDGVMADNSIASDVREWLWDSPTKPINPRTGTYFTDQEIRNAYIQLHKEIKNAIGSKLLVCNGIWNGGRFFDRYNSYMEIISNSPLDVIVSEGLWNANNKYWYSEGDWLDSLNFMVWVQDNFLRNHPDRYFVAVDYSNENIIPGSDENQTALYGFASTLLGAKTNQNNLAVGWNWDADFLEFMDKLHKIEVGFPENDYYTIEGTHVYTRDFSKVKVLVNPTDYSYTINLDSSYKTLDGRIVSSITMINHTGEILLKT